LTLRFSSSLGWITIPSAANVCAEGREIQPHYFRGHLNLSEPSIGLAFIYLFLISSLVALSSRHDASTTAATIAPLLQRRVPVRTIPAAMTASGGSLRRWRGQEDRSAGADSGETEVIADATGPSSRATPRPISRSISRSTHRGLRAWLIYCFGSPHTKPYLG